MGGECGADTVASTHVTYLYNQGSENPMLESLLSLIEGEGVSTVQPMLLRDVY